MISLKNKTKPEAVTFNFLASLSPSVQEYLFAN